MKAVILLLLSISFLATSNSSFGQATSPREIVKKTVPKDQRTPPAPPAPPASTPSPKKAAAPVKTKTEAEKNAMDQRAVEFQTKRAKEGSPTAQYDLGVRYLEGKGVEKNEEEGRKWLELSAKQGNTSAIRKIQELDKKPKTEPVK